MGEPHQVLHEIDPGHAFGQTLFFPQDATEPHDALTIGVDQICVHDALVEFGILAHQHDLSGIDHGMVQLSSALDRLVHNVHRFPHGKPIDGDPQDLYALMVGHRMPPSSITV